MFREEYANVFGGNETWNAIPVAEGDLFPWDNADSTYIQEPPFFVDLAAEPAVPPDIRGAKVAGCVWATASPPTTSRRRAASRRTARRDAT